MSDTPTLGEDLKRLEEIVRRLEADDLPIEEALAIFEEGVGRLRAAKLRLAEAETRVVQVLRDTAEDGTVRLEVDARLDRAAERIRGETPGRLGEALAYALRSPGKRVRPALVLAAYRATGGSDPAVGGIAAAVEIVHTYSLVHDDLPCMDD